MKLIHLLFILPIIFWVQKPEVNLDQKLGDSEWILHIHPSSDINQVISDLKKNGVAVYNPRKITRNMDLYLVKYSESILNKEEFTNRVFDSKYIKNVTPNAKIEYRDTRPNDIHYSSEQANMETIDAPRVWDLTTGGVTPNGDQIVVAVVDGAFQINHVDLIENIITFDGEIPGDNIDNDGNGYIDDVHGWNSFEGEPIINTQADHGTGVAGIVGAKGNNEIGVTGVNWNVKILPIATRSINSGAASVASILAGYDYVLEQRKIYNESNGTKGAYVVATNSSFGQSNSSEAENIDWCQYYDLLAEQGILNVSASTNTNIDVMSEGDIPSLCTSTNLLVVNNVTPSDLFHSSGFSSSMVDIAAPGEGGLTLDDNSRYGVLGGTSSASPHVAGAIGLLYSLPCERLGLLMKNDPISYMEILKTALLDGVDILPSLAGKNVTGGRLNIGKSMDILLDRCDLDIPNGDLEIIKVYPVPARDHLTIEYQNDNLAETCISLYDANGKFVRTYNTDPLLQGTKEFKIKDMDVPAGVYFFRFPCENPELTHSIIVH